MSNSKDLNTKISYLYRDADNYKMANECIINGVLTDDQKMSILSCLNDELYFIPSQVGLPENRFDDGVTEADHCWFELDDLGFEETKKSPTLNITPEVLVKAFLDRKDRWDDGIELQSGSEVSIDTSEKIHYEVVTALIKAMAAYGMESNWCDSDIIDALVNVGITEEDFRNAGFESFVKEYFLEDALQKCVAIEYKGIIFDEWSVDKENGSAWAEMCACCADKYKDQISAELDDGSAIGICSVLGCEVSGLENDSASHFYVDLKPEFIHPLTKEQLLEKIKNEPGKKVGLDQQIEQATSYASKADSSEHSQAKAAKFAR